MKILTKSESVLGAGWVIRIDGPLDPFAVVVPVGCAVIGLVGLHVVAVGHLGVGAILVEAVGFSLEKSQPGQLFRSLGRFCIFTEYKNRFKFFKFEMFETVKLKSWFLNCLEIMSTSLQLWLYFSALCWNLFSFLEIVEIVTSPIELYSCQNK